LRALIVGGGIGGLAVALACTRAGIEAEVYERAPELHEIGAGLSLWSNAVAALGRLGIRDEVIARSDPIERAVTVTSDGAVLSDVPLRELVTELGEPSVCAHRADLQRTLATALGADRIHLGADCVAIEEDASGVTARFANGASARADVAVGADGIRSVVREHLLGDRAPRYAGYFALRGVARCEPRRLPPGAGLFGLGRGAQAGFIRCGGGRVYWFATVNAPQGTTIAVGRRKESALGRFGGWFPVAAEVIEATPEEAVLVNDIVDRPPARTTGRGRITLVGDAAHPTTPNLGQGACQALEDAVVLADSLSRLGSNAEALRRYENVRRARTAMVQRQSWWLGKLFQLENAAAIELRNRFIRSRTGQKQTTSSLLGVLRHDLPALNAPA